MNLITRFVALLLLSISISTVHQYNSSSTRDSRLKKKEKRSGALEKQKEDIVLNLWHICQLAWQMCHVPYDLTKGRVRDALNLFFGVVM